MYLIHDEDMKQHTPYDIFQGISDVRREAQRNNNLLHRAETIQLEDDWRPKAVANKQQAGLELYPGFRLIYTR